MAAIGASLPLESRELGFAAVPHLSRYRGTSREHTESDLRVFFNWCQDRQLAPLIAQRNDLELYLRWMLDVRRFKPSTVSRRRPSSPASTAPASSTEYSNTRRRSTSAGRPSRQNHQLSG